MSSVAFGSNQSEEAFERLRYAISTASDAYQVGDESSFKSRTEIAIEHLRGMAESSQKQLLVEELNDVVESASGSSSYPDLKQKINTL